MANIEERKGRGVFIGGKPTISVAVNCSSGSAGYATKAPQILRGLLEHTGGQGTLGGLFEIIERQLWLALR